MASSSASSLRRDSSAELRLSPLGGSEIGDLEVGPGRVGAEEERLVGTAQVGAGLAVRRSGAGVADLARQDDRGGQIALRPKHPRNHRAGVRLRIVRR